MYIHTVGFGQGKSTRMNAVRGFHPPSRRYKFSLSILGIGNLLMPREGKVSLRRSPSAGGECEEEGNRDRVGLVSVKRFTGLLLPVVIYVLYFIDRSFSNPSFLRVFVNECYLEDKFRKFPYAFAL